MRFAKLQERDARTPQRVTCTLTRKNTLNLVLSIGNHNADYEEMQDVMNNLEKMDIRSRSDCNRWLIKNHPDKIRNLRAREVFDIQKFTDVIKWCKKLKANEAKNRRR